MRESVRWSGRSMETETWMKERKKLHRNNRRTTVQHLTPGRMDSYFISLLHCYHGNVYLNIESLSKVANSTHYTVLLVCLDSACTRTADGKTGTSSYSLFLSFLWFKIFLYSSSTHKRWDWTNRTEIYLLGCLTFRLDRILQDLSFHIREFPPFIKPAAESVLIT